MTKVLSVLAALALCATFTLDADAGSKGKKKGHAKKNTVVTTTLPAASVGGSDVETTTDLCGGWCQPSEWTVWQHGDSFPCNFYKNVCDNEPDEYGFGACRGFLLTDVQCLIENGYITTTTTTTLPQ